MQRYIQMVVLTIFLVASVRTAEAQEFLRRVTLPDLLASFDVPRTLAPRVDSIVRNSLEECQERSETQCRPRTPAVRDPVECRAVLLGYALRFAVWRLDEEGGIVHSRTWSLCGVYGYWARLTESALQVASREDGFDRTMPAVAVPARRQVASDGPRWPAVTGRYGSLPGAVEATVGEWYGHPLGAWAVRLSPGVSIPEPSRLPRLSPARYWAVRVQVVNRNANAGVPIVRAAVKLVDTAGQLHAPTALYFENGGGYAGRPQVLGGGEQADFVAIFTLQPTVSPAVVEFLRLNDFRGESFTGAVVLAVDAAYVARIRAASAAASAVHRNNRTANVRAEEERVLALAEEARRRFAADSVRLFHAPAPAAWFEAGDLERSPPDVAARLMNNPLSKRRHSVRRSGDVLLRFVVLPSGRVDPSRIEVVSSTHSELTRAALQVVEELYFIGARRGRARVAAVVRLSLNFPGSSD